MYLRSTSKQVQIRANVQFNTSAMPNVTLLVSPLVKQYFISTYGGQPIKIHRSDIVYHHLQSHPIISNPHRYRQLQKYLTETLTLEVSDRIARHLRAKKRNVYVGYHLHKIYQDQILVYVHAQVQVGEDARKAMRKWLKDHNVQEDDYGLDSAYTTWKRKKTFFSAINKDKKAQYVHTPDPAEKESLRSNQIHILDYRDVIQHVSVYFKISEDYLLMKDRENKTYSTCCEKVFSRKILYYIMKKYCMMSGLEISNLLNRHHSSINRNFKDIDFSYNHYDDVKVHVDTIVNNIYTKQLQEQE